MIELWISWSPLALTKPGTWECLLMALCTLLALLFLIRSRRDFARLSWRRLLLFVGLLIAPLLTEHALVLKYAAPDLPPPPNVPFEPSHPAVPLLGAIPIVAAGAWLGAGPALLVGLVGGILRANAMTGGITEPLYLAFWGALIGLLLRQDYRGRLPLLARQPLLAALIIVPFVLPLRLFSIFVHVADAGLAGFDYAAMLTKAYLGPQLVESLTAACAIQALYLFFPRLRPVCTVHRPPPYGLSLNRRLLCISVLMLVLAITVLLYAVITTTLHMAIIEAVSTMSRDASIAAEDVPHFIYTGQGLLTGFASDARLWSDDPSILTTCLKNYLRTGIFFSQLLLLEQDGRLLAMYPPADDSTLTAQEEVLVQRVFTEGAVQVSRAYRSAEGEAALSFLVPLEQVGDESGPSSRVLVGRTFLNFNPLLNRILNSLQWTSGEGEGFIVDLEGRVISHSDPALFLSEWRVEANRPRIYTGPRGWAYESRNPRDNTRQIVYYMPVEGYPWAVVIQLPYEVVLARAHVIARPLLILLVLFGGAGVLFVPLVTGLLTRPLNRLAAAAEEIAQGNLAQPVQVTGDDEVGRVGSAFENMRVRLKNRMEDLSLLLEISQTVSATLDLSVGVPLILEGALKATTARIARVVLLSASGEPQVVMSRGEPIAGLEALDRVLVTALQGREGPLIVENLARARSLALPETLNGALKTVAALPVRTQGRAVAAMWVGYSEVCHLDELDLGLLSTLATQMAVLVENTRLFKTAEDGRWRLSAILDSVTDAILVTDHDDRILLLNPAAERAFGVTADALVGQQIEQAGLDPVLVQAFKAPLPPGHTPTREVPLPDGRTLHASVSTISGTGGERIGRVAVLHDITHFKELDEMKSEFLAAVSHDLRAPLIYMRGYANMLLAMNHDDAKQRECIEKILYGVEQINDLVSDLLDLGRIETGVGLERRPCHLVGVLIEAVDSMRAQAAAKEISLRLEPFEGKAIVSGDAALLRQAVTNLLDNAIKYTPSGGIVTVGLALRMDGGKKRAVIRVSDTGIGIAPQDQVRLFEKFYRIKPRGVDSMPGTGLGLALVKSIVERHEGKVWVDSELNEGSTFYISLPLNDDE